MILIIWFVPPVYFMKRGRWGECFLNSIPYGIACLCLLSILGAWLAPCFWILSAGHAAWQYRQEEVNRLMHQHADLVATKMAGQMQVISRPTAEYCGACGRPRIPGDGECACSSAPGRGPVREGQAGD